MEADLAFAGIDFRDYWLPGGGPTRLSLRRALLLIRALPSTATWRAELAAETRSEKTAKLVSRRDHYAAQKARQEAARDR